MKVWMVILALLDRNNFTQCVTWRFDVLPKDGSASFTGAVIANVKSNRLAVGIRECLSRCAAAEGDCSEMNYDVSKMNCPPAFMTADPQLVVAQRKTLLRPTGGSIVASAYGNSDTSGILTTAAKLGLSSTDKRVSSYDSDYTTALAQSLSEATQTTISLENSRKIETENSTVAGEALEESASAMAILSDCTGCRDASQTIASQDSGSKAVSAIATTEKNVLSTAWNFLTAILAATTSTSVTSISESDSNCESCNSSLAAYNSLYATDGKVSNDETVNVIGLSTTFNVTEAVVTGSTNYWVASENETISIYLNSQLANVSVTPSDNAISFGLTVTGSAGAASIAGAASSADASPLNTNDSSCESCSSDSSKMDPSLPAATTTGRDQVTSESIRSTMAFTWAGSHSDGAASTPPVLASNTNDSGCESCSAVPSAMNSRLAANNDTSKNQTTAQNFISTTLFTGEDQRSDVALNTGVTSALNTTVSDCESCSSSSNKSDSLQKMNNTVSIPMATKSFSLSVSSTASGNFSGDAANTEVKSSPNTTVSSCPSCSSSSTMSGSQATTKSTLSVQQTSQTVASALSSTQSAAFAGAAANTEVTTAPTTTVSSCQSCTTSSKTSDSQATTKSTLSVQLTSQTVVSAASSTQSVAFAGTTMSALVIAVSNSTKKMKYISVGTAGVWAIGVDGWAYYKSNTAGFSNSTGGDWQQSPVLKNVTWLVSGIKNCIARSSSGVFVRQGSDSSWSASTISYTNISLLAIYSATASPSNGMGAYGLNENYTLSIQSLPPPTAAATNAVASCGDSLWSDISFGPSGLWAVSPNGTVFYLNGSRGASTQCVGSAWIIAYGNFKQVASGNNLVIGRHADGELYARTNISSAAPAGTGWKQLALNISVAHVSVSNTNLVWLVATTGNVYTLSIV